MISCEFKSNTTFVISVLLTGYLVKTDWNGRVMRISLYIEFNMSKFQTISNLKSLTKNLTATYNE